jgi:hypothetical protein
MNRTTELLLLIFLVAPTTLWMSLAVYYHSPHRWLRVSIAMLPVTVVGSAVWLLPLVPWGIAIWLATLAATLVWWFSRQPRSDRDWAVGMDVLPRVSIDGNLVRIEHYRHFDYDAAGRPLPHYEERTFDLAKLQSVDFFLSHWTGPMMAHTLVSFGFDDGQYLAVSVEARRQRWQSYSPLWGLFRAYELMYVLGDERDIVRLRTNIRHERVYMYRVCLPVDRIRTLFVDYLKRAESVARRPEWYNSITSNCTTNLFYHEHGQIRRRLRPGIFFNGLSARTLYKLGGLASRLPFSELQARSAIQDLARAAGDSADFSRQIRARIVVPQPAIEELTA